MSTSVWTISKLVRYLKNSLDNDINIQTILLKGEISNFTNHRSGHLYFSLKDTGAKMNCVMFSSYASKLKIVPKDGMQVIALVKVSMYEPQGNMQLYVSELQSDGIGDLYLQFEALKEKLSKAGLFEEKHKKALVTYPKSIGIISAKTGAAIQDVLSIISRRWPICEVSVYPSLVQGEKASTDMIEKLKIADTSHHDIILLVRGGGSLEDLWCFNNELLATTIYHMNTCVVSGVGHESDTTLVDYVSDKRAPTPSAAAELVTPNMNEVKEQIHLYKQRMIRTQQVLLSKQRLRIETIKEKPLFQSSEYYIQNEKLKLAILTKSLFHIENKIKLYRQNYGNQKDKFNLLANQIKSVYQKELLLNQDRLVEAIKNKQQQDHDLLSKNISLLDAFSPLKILQRGYSITLLNEKTIKNINDVKENDIIDIKLNDGSLKASVMERKS